MTKIEKIISERETKGFRFKPSKDFYIEVKIRQKRWGQIYRGEVSLTINEMLTLAKYFGVKPEEFLEDLST